MVSLEFCSRHVRPDTDVVDKFGDQQCGGQAKASLNGNMWISEDPFVQWTSCCTHDLGLLHNFGAYSQVPGVNGADVSVLVYDRQCKGMPYSIDLKLSLQQFARLLKATCTSSCNRDNCRSFCGCEVDC